MSESSPASKRTSVEAFLAIPEHERFHELLGGELVPKASPSGEHSNAQGGVIASLRGPFQRKPGGGGPGGWWIYPEPEILLQDDTIIRPDVAGWRRETSAEPPAGTLIAVRPDWVCEVLSPSPRGREGLRPPRAPPELRKSRESRFARTTSRLSLRSNANNDTVRKLRLFHAEGVPHYWLIDPRDETLTVLRWSEDGYVNRLVAERGEVVRPEPFEAIELEVGVLFGDDPTR